MAKKPKVFTEKEVTKRLAAVSDWKANSKHTQITKDFSFPNFVNGLAFVAKVAVVSEVEGHHPDIELSYGAVKVKLTTHDAKGLTTKDFALAKKIDQVRLPQ